MSTAKTGKTEKNCLLAFRNKKINPFDGVNSLCAKFAFFGYWFDKISFVCFDNSEEIVRAVNEAKENYENVVLFCPQAMETTLKNYTSKLYSSGFDNFGVLNAQAENVFMIFSDAQNRLEVADVCKILDKKYTHRVERAYVKTVGAPAEKINCAIAKASAMCGEINFNVSDKFGDCAIEILYNEDTPKSVFDGVNRTVVGTLNDYVYALEDVSLAERLIQLLKLRRMKISVAESFTGGGICKRLVEVSGASEVFYEGLNTYSNEAKAERLGVEEMTLKHYGAVSEETAYEMAEGLIKSGNCDVCIATTGIAGPKSDNTNKPVGLCYIAVGLKDGVSVYKYNLNGSRKEITETAINLALFLAFKLIK